MRGALAIVAAILVLAPGCIDHSTRPELGAQGDATPKVAAFHSTVIDTSRQGSEPTFVLGPDGSVFVCSPRQIGSGSDLWVSTDNGTTFHFVGTDPGSSSLPILRSGGGDVGGGDCDVGMDAAGRVYLADLWAGGVSLSSTTDRGATWRGVPVSTAIAPQDRPWVLGGAKDEVFLTAAQLQATGTEQRGINMPPVGGIWVARSTDGGLTFPQRTMAAGNENRLGLASNLARDDKNLYVLYTKKIAEGKLALMLAVSGDQGATWEQRTVAQQSFFPGQCFGPLDVFPVVATDGIGGVYLAWALQNPETQRDDLFTVASPDHGRTWTKPVLVTDRSGTRSYPWIAAEGPGHIGLVWYETNVTLLLKSAGDGTCTTNTPPDAGWYLHYAFSDDAHNSTPHFTETLVQPQPVHNGTLDQPYAEVLQVHFTLDGRAATAYVADVPDGTARPMFAIQTGP